MREKSIEFDFDSDVTFAFKVNEKNSVAYIRHINRTSWYGLIDGKPLIKNKLDQQDFIFRLKILKGSNASIFIRNIDTAKINKSSLKTLHRISSFMSNELLQQIETVIIPLPSLLEEPFLAFTKQKHKAIDKAKNGSKLLISYLKFTVICLYEELKAIKYDYVHNQEEWNNHYSDLKDEYGEEAIEVNFTESNIEYINTIQHSILSKRHTDGSWLSILRQLVKMPRPVEYQLTIFDEVFNTITKDKLKTLDKLIELLNRFKHEPFDHNSFINYSEEVLPDLINSLRPSFAKTKLYIPTSLESSGEKLLVRAKLVMSSSKIYEDTEFETSLNHSNFPTNKVVAYNSRFDKAIVFDDLVKVEQESIETFRVKLFDRIEGDNIKYE